MSRRTVMNTTAIIIFACAFLFLASRATEALIATEPMGAPGAAPATWTPDPDITAMLASDPALFDRQLDIAMRKTLKDPASLSITIVSKDPAARSRGFLDKVTVRKRRGTLDGLVLDQADIDFENVQLDTTRLMRENKVDLISVKNIYMDVTIREDDLNAFLEAKSKSIKVDNPRVKLLDGRMELEGSTRYSFMRVKFWASGGFDIVDSREIWFHARRMRMNNLAMPRAFIGSIIRQINPVLNLDTFPFRLNLREIKIERGALRFLSFRQDR